MRTRLGTILFSVALAALRAESPSETEIRNGAARALTLIQATQKVWASKQSCVSCHHQVLPLLATVVANEHGIPFDIEAARTNAAAIAQHLRGIDRSVQYHGMIDPALSDGYILTGAAAAGLPPSLNSAIFARHIAVRQKSDGHWVTWDARPPQSYGSITSTAVAVRAIRQYSHKSLAADTANRVGRAAAWLDTAPTRTTEDRVFQMLGLHWAGRDPRRFARELAGLQREDGGWAALDSRKSDAYSTGLVLNALYVAGGLVV